VTGKWSKWDYLLDQKPKPLATHLLEEVAKRLAKDLNQFPPPIEGFESESAEARFKPLFEPPTRPHDDVYRAAFHLAKLELQREIEAIDEYMRNQRYKPLAPSDRDYLSMLFLSRWLTEQMLALSEAVQTRLPRPKLVECLEDVERRVLGAPLLN
jgi:hypothetical protein